VLTAKGDFVKVLEFLHQFESSFGLVIDNKKLVIRTLLKKGDKLAAMNELVEMIRVNYENVGGDFQSIYDHHEILISMLVEEARAQGVTVDDAFITGQLDDSA
jgi:archaellum component FlaC